MARRSSKMSSILLTNGKRDNNGICFSTGFFLVLADKLIVVNSRQRRDEEVACYGDLGCFRDEVRLF